MVSFFDVTKGYKLCNNEKQILFWQIFTNFWTNQIVWKTNKWVNQRITQAGKFVKLCNDKIWFLLTHPLNSSHVCKSLPWVLGFLNIRGLNKYVAQRLCKFSHAKFTKLLRCSKDDKTENIMRHSACTSSKPWLVIFSHIPLPHEIESQTFLQKGTNFSAR